MKLPRLSFLKRPKPKFAPTPEEQVLIENCTRFGIGHVEIDRLLDEAGLLPDRRGPVEQIIRDKIMDSVLKSARERRA